MIICSHYNITSVRSRVESKKNMLEQNMRSGTRIVRRRINNGSNQSLFGNRARSKTLISIQTKDTGGVHRYNIMVILCVGCKRVFRRRRRRCSTPSTAHPIAPPSAVTRILQSRSHIINALHKDRSCRGRISRAVDRAYNSVAITISKYVLQSVRSGCNNDKPI